MPTCSSLCARCMNTRSPACRSSRATGLPAVQLLLGGSRHANARAARPRRRPGRCSRSRPARRRRIDRADRASSGRYRSDDRGSGTGGGSLPGAASGGEPAGRSHVRRGRASASMSGISTVRYAAAAPPGSRHCGRARPRFRGDSKTPHSWRGPRRRYRLPHASHRRIGAPRSAVCP